LPRILNSVYPAYTVNPTNKMHGTILADPCECHCVTSHTLSI